MRISPVLKAVQRIPPSSTRCQLPSTARPTTSLFRPASVALGSQHTLTTTPTLLRTMSSTSSASTTTTAATSATAATATTSTAQPSAFAPPPMTFPKSPVPKNPLGEGRHIRTAAALIIGDEILNGKTHDRNSHVFAQYCFENGVDLKRIEVVADDEGEIVEASRRLAENYDFVVTSGGIGPTHDDITYESLATAFDQPLSYHDETVHRLTEMTKHRPWVQQQNEEQRKATKRMALLPTGGDTEVLFVGEDLWVPIVRLKGKLCVLPGVPGLFQKLLHLLTPFLPLPPKSQRPLRIQVFTDRPESLIAPYLTTLQTRLKPHGIQVGSYPILGQGVFVSLIGRDLATPRPAAEGDAKPNNTKTRIWLAEVAKEVETEVGGKVVSEEEVALKKERSLSNISAAAASLGAKVVLVEPEAGNNNKAKI